MSNNKPFRVAISGKSGCGNTTVTGILAKRLQINMINYTFHNIAEEQGLDFEELCRMAEKDPKWDYFVDENQVKLAMEGSSVLGSRLAIWMLKEADLKVFLTASPKTRAERIQHRRGGPLKSGQKKRPGGMPGITPGTGSSMKSIMTTITLPT